MKKTALYVLVGFLAGLFFQNAVLTRRVFAQAPSAPNRPLLPQTPLANLRFALLDAGRNNVGMLSFDGAGIPVISFTGILGDRLRGRITRILCEIRPAYAPTPLQSGN